MRTWTGLLAVVMVTAVALTGCLGVKTPPITQPETPTLFVDYQRSGGIAGVNDRLVIFDNGVTLVSSRTTSRELLLNESDLEQIAAVFDAAQFPALEGNYTSSRGGADLFQYSISYRGKTVNTEDTAVPAALEPVIKEMNRVLSAGLNSGQSNLPLYGITP
ncbi:MAG TPA: hypothetical protein VLL74_04825 [Methanoregula sp.]|nr:hypothetical protein [Methanoregula sp.]